MFKSKKAKKVTSVALLSLLMGVFVLSSSVLVYAENTDINEIGGTTTVETTVTEQQSNISNSQTANQSNATTSNTATTTNTNNGTSGGNQVTQNAGKNESTAEAVGDLFSAAGVDSESAAKAKKWIEPVAKVLNTVTAVILGLFASMLILVSVLDMVYLGIPITRQWLCPGGADMGAGAAAGGADLWHDRFFVYDTGADHCLLQCHDGAGCGDRFADTACLCRRIFLCRIYLLFHNARHC